MRFWCGRKRQGNKGKTKTNYKEKKDMLEKANMNFVFQFRLYRDDPVNGIWQVTFALDTPLQKKKLAMLRLLSHC